MTRRCQAAARRSRPSMPPAASKTVRMLFIMHNFRAGLWGLAQQALEIFEPLFDLLQLGAQLAQFFFQLIHAAGLRGGCVRGLRSLDHHWLAAQQMSIAGFFLSGLLFEPGPERTARPFGQPLERSLGFAQFTKGKHALAAALDLAERLRPAQQECAKHGAFPAAEVQGLGDALRVLIDAAAACYEDGEAFLAKAFERALDGVGVVIDHGLAIVLLVAAGDQGIQAERIILGRSRFFLEQSAEYARLFGAKRGDGHRSPEQKSAGRQSGRSRKTLPPGRAAGTSAF